MIDKGDKDLHLVVRRDVDETFDFFFYVIDVVKNFQSVINGMKKNTYNLGNCVTYGKIFHIFVYFHMCKLLFGLYITSCIVWSVTESPKYT